MKTFCALITISAECEEDFHEQLSALDSYEIEWWKQVSPDHSEWKEMIDDKIDNDYPPSPMYMRYLEEDAKLTVIEQKAREKANEMSKLW